MNESPSEARLHNAFGWACVPLAVLTFVVLLGWGWVR